MVCQVHGTGRKFRRIFVSYLHAKALYPSLKIGQSANVVADTICDTEVTINRMNYFWALMDIAPNGKFTQLIREEIEGIALRECAKEGL